jgi:hypothetical protein
LDSGFDESQIRDEVYKYIFKRGIPNFNINALISQCMQLYSDIIIEQSNILNLAQKN